MSKESFVHPSADVSPDAVIGAGTKIWQSCQVREGARIGELCVLGKGVYVDKEVSIGNKCKIQNEVTIYQGVRLEDGVFCGPHSVFTNDLRPRAINPDKSLQGADDWSIKETLVKTGASIGANATILCGIVVGKWAMVGAGAVVTSDVPDHGLIYGNPAQLHGFVCKCGEAGAFSKVVGDEVHFNCVECEEKVVISRSVYEDSSLASRLSR